MPLIKDGEIEYLYVTDANYFKKLAKQTKAKPHLGYVLPCALPGYENVKVIYGIPYTMLFANPNERQKYAHEYGCSFSDYKGTKGQFSEEVLKQVVTLKH